MAINYIEFIKYINILKSNNKNKNQEQIGGKNNKNNWLRNFMSLYENSDNYQLSNHRSTNHIIPTIDSNYGLSREMAFDDKQKQKKKNETFFYRNHQDSNPRPSWC
jgi:hypothetical protein